jgi:hypothetical protein
LEKEDGVEMTSVRTVSVRLGLTKSSDLREWFKEEKWVNIARKKKGGGYEPCGRSDARTSTKGKPKCVPAAKAARMSASDRKSAVRRKRAKDKDGSGTPVMVKTDKEKRSFTLRKVCGG